MSLPKGGGALDDLAIWCSASVQDKAFAVEQHQWQKKGAFRYLLFLKGLVKLQVSAQPEIYLFRAGWTGRKQ